MINTQAAAAGATVPTSTKSATGQQLAAMKAPKTNSSH